MQMRTVIRKPEWRERLGRCRHRWKDSIKVDLKVAGYKGETPYCKQGAGTALIISGGDCKFRSSSLPHKFVLSLSSRNQVVHPYKAAGRIIVFISIFSLSDRGREDRRFLSQKQQEFPSLNELLTSLWVQF
jgi:hypothetical protein